MPTNYIVIKERRKTDEDYAERLRKYGRDYREKNIDSERNRNREYAAKKRSESKEAYNEYMRQWTRKNKEKINAARRERRKNDPEFAKKERERAKLKTAEYRKNKSLKIKYKISLDDFNKMREEQNFSCAICGSHEENCGKHKLVVDHCHSTGKVRKLLCGYCNTGLGQFKDNVELLAKAINYLNSTKG